MIRTVFRQGMLQLLEPPPGRWVEGQEIDVEECGHSDEGWLPEAGHDPEYLEDPTDEELDQWLREMNELCAHNSPENHAIMMKAIAEHRAEQKAIIAKEMGLE